MLIQIMEQILARLTHLENQLQQAREENLTLRGQLEVMNANTQEVTDRVAQHEQYQGLLFVG